MSAPIIGKIAIPSASEYTSLRTICGSMIPPKGRFKGIIAFPDTNAGAANVLKATVTNGADVVCDAGAFHEWISVDADLLLIKGAVTDYINIVGEAI